MARPLRIEYDNAFYHVMNRGRGRQTVFHDADYYRVFLDCLAEAYERFGLEVHSYCLMGNHYHLLVKTPHGNLGRAMRHVNGRYTQRHNRLKKTDGPLFRGRYKAVLVDAGSYLLQASRYIHRNPIDMTTPLVADLSQYPWSSYPGFVKKQAAPDWLYRDAVFAELGVRNKYQGYRNFVTAGNDPEIERFYSAGKTAAILGDEKFRDRVLVGLTAPGDEVVHRDARRAVEVEAILRAVESHFSCGRQAFLTAVRGRGPRNYARWIAMKLCQTQGQLSLVEIAQWFNVGNYCTVSQTIRRLEDALAEGVLVGGQPLAGVLNTISKDLTP